MSDAESGHPREAGSTRAHPFLLFICAIDLTSPVTFPDKRHFKKYDLPFETTLIV
jgi:hypothetical protein